MSFDREWMCCFCLTVSDQKGFDNRPARCKSCCVVRCASCGTYIKGDKPKLCHGCGEFMPKADAAFVGTDQTGSIYVEADWCRRNKGRHATGDYCIATGYANDDSDRMSSWINKKTDQGHEDVRELTEDEKLQLKRDDNV